MQLRRLLTASALILIILGISMIYIGGIYSQKVILPPIITGIGFFMISWVLLALRKNQ